MTKEERAHHFNSKQPIDINANELTSKLKHQGFYSNGTTGMVGDSTIHNVIGERLSKTDRPVKVLNFPKSTVANMKHYILFQKSTRNQVTLFHTSGQMLQKVYHREHAR